jgi:hypothetical protein
VHELLSVRPRDFALARRLEFATVEKVGKYSENLRIVKVIAHAAIQLLGGPLITNETALLFRVGQKICSERAV